MFISPLKRRKGRFLQDPCLEEARPGHPKASMQRPQWGGPCVDHKSNHLPETKSQIHRCKRLMHQESYHCYKKPDPTLFLVTWVSSTLPCPCLFYSFSPQGWSKQPKNVQTHLRLFLLRRCSHGAGFLLED